MDQTKAKQLWTLDAAVLGGAWFSYPGMSILQCIGHIGYYNEISIIVYILSFSLSFSLFLSFSPYVFNESFITMGVCHFQFLGLPSLSQKCGSLGEMFTVGNHSQSCHLFCPFFFHFKMLPKLTKFMSLFTEPGYFQTSLAVWQSQSSPHWSPAEC